MDRLRYLTDQTPTVNDVALLILRVVVAVIFFRHGWADIFESGVANNVEAQRGVGIPVPEFSARFSAYLQFAGGALLFVGLFSRLVSAGFVVIMAGALIWVHGSQQIPIGPDGSGSGFAIIMGGASLALLLTGPGRLSLDHVIAARVGDPEPAVVATPVGRAT